MKSMVTFSVLSNADLLIHLHIGKNVLGTPITNETQRPHGFGHRSLFDPGILPRWVLPEEEYIKLSYAADHDSS
jgi:hypothetical protein